MRQCRFPAVPTINPNMNQPSAGLEPGGFATTNGLGSSHQSRPNSAGYFQYHQPQRTYVDDETLSNTLANSHIAPPQNDNLQIANRQPKFTEEWDASVRGGSIVDGPSSQQSHYQPSSMQRSNSVSSRAEVIPADGANNHAISLSRGNTLKKKSSLRRSGSLKRSSSRRSMKAGSVRSLALQSSHDSDEIHSAFFCPVPTTGSPTELLANRFQSRLRHFQ